MLTAEGKRLVDEYLNWLKEGFHLESLGSHMLISTPFLDPHNDEIEIFVEKHGEQFKLTDDGYTISDLASMGLEINSPKRIAHVKQIVGSFGVRWEDGELSVNTNARDFPQKKHNLIQAILAVHDLSVMGQSHVLQFFQEDVAAFLTEKSIPYFSSIKFSGKSGFDHRFDFAFPKMGSRPEASMQAINNLTRDVATSVAFAVHDVQLQRGNEADFMSYAIINDREFAPADDHLDALRAYGIKPYLWSSRGTLAEELVRN